MMTTREVAERAGISVDGVLVSMRRGLGPAPARQERLEHSKGGARWRWLFRDDEVLEWLDSRNTLHGKRR